jgi:hypothetical protein
VAVGQGEEGGPEVMHAVHPPHQPATEGKAGMAQGPNGATAMRVRECMKGPNWCNVCLKPTQGAKVWSGLSALGKRC